MIMEIFSLKKTTSAGLLIASTVNVEARIRQNRLGHLISTFIIVKVFAL